jgi:RHS repeat-associated protein
MFTQDWTDQLKMRKGEKSYFFHQNSIGSVYFITDEEGKIVEKVEYDPYGEPRFLIPTGDQGNPYRIQFQSSIGNAYLFQGREYDYETSLYNFRMRYYDPELCRFISPDPEGYKDSLNLYQAFKLNPINFVDPMGSVTGNLRFFKHLVNSEEEIPNNPFRRKGVTRLRENESGIYGYCKLFKGKWIPRFKFDLTFDVWYKKDTIAEEHELAHVSDITKEYNRMWRKLLEIELFHINNPFKYKTDCEEYVLKIENEVFYEVQKIQTGWTYWWRDLLPFYDIYVYFKYSVKNFLKKSLKKQNEI